MNIRRQKAMGMIKVGDHFAQVDVDKFKIKSQSDPKKEYIVSRTGKCGLICQCNDWTVRKADCSHIHFVKLMIMRNRGYANNNFKIIQRVKLNLCKYCDGGRIIKKGIRTTKRNKVQIYQCKDYTRKFTTNFGFEKKRYSPNTITGALQMYYADMSVRDISTHYEMLGIDVDHSSVYRWIADYAIMTKKYLDEIVPRVGNQVRVDEVWVKVNEKQNYPFASMDDDIRFWLAKDMAETKFQHNADTLLKLTKKAIGNKTPRHFTTDGHPAYEKSSRRIFGKKTQHNRHIHLHWYMNNNKMERLNGEIRGREKIFRGLKKKDSPIIDGMKAYYNFTKKHGGIGG